MGGNKCKQTLADVVYVLGETNQTNYGLRIAPSDRATNRRTNWYLGSVYTGPDPFRSGTKLVRLSGTRWVHLWRWSYVEPYRSSLEPVLCKQGGSVPEWIRSRVNVALITFCGGYKIWKSISLIAAEDSVCWLSVLILSGPGGERGSEARMTKLTAANQKPLTLWCPNLVTRSDQILAKLISQGGCCCSFLIETS